LSNLFVAASLYLLVQLLTLLCVLCVGVFLVPTRKEADMILSTYYPGICLEEINKKISVQLVSQPRLEPNTPPNVGQEDLTEFEMASLSFWLVSR
jgi:hypothetical protein